MRQGHEVKQMMYVICHDRSNHSGGSRIHQVGGCWHARHHEANPATMVWTQSYTQAEAEAVLRAERRDIRYCGNCFR